MADLPKELKFEVATAEKDPFHPAWDGVFKNWDPTLLARGYGYGLDLYDEIRQDPHALSVLEKRQMAVIARPWVVKEASQSRLDCKAADMVRDQLMGISGLVGDDDESLVTDPGFDGMCKRLLDAQLYGFAVGEGMWERDGTMIRLAEFRPRKQRRFTFVKGANGGFRLQLITPTNMYRGEEIPRRKFIVQSFGSIEGSPFGHALGSVLYWPVYFKRQDVSYWLHFGEKFGEPTVIGEFPQTASSEEKRKLLAAAKAIHRKSAIAIPQGMILKLLEAARTQAGDFFYQMAEYFNSEISKAVLGETLSTSVGDKGSFAASKTHNEVRVELAKADADLLSASLNRTVCRWITDLNVPGANPPTVWRDFEESEDLSSSADRDVKLYSIGYRRTLASVQDTYPGDYEDVRVAAPAVPQTQPQPQFAEPRTDSPDTADYYSAQASDASLEVMDGLIAPVRKLVMSAKSLAELRDGLAKIYPKMPSGDLVNLIQRSRTAANLAGRFEVSNGN